MTYERQVPQGSSPKRSAGERDLLGSAFEPAHALVLLCDSSRHPVEPCGAHDVLVHAQVGRFSRAVETTALNAGWQALVTEQTDGRVRILGRRLEQVSNDRPAQSRDATEGYRVTFIATPADEVEAMDPSPTQAPTGPDPHLASYFDVPDGVDRSVRPPAHFWEPTRRVA